MSRRFAILGAHPERVSPLGRQSIAKLLAAGFTLAAWLEGDDKTCTDLEFILQLDETDPPAHLLNVPRLGVWRFASATPGPLAFWDVYDGAYHMEVRLERLTERTGWTIPLERRWLKVDRCSYGRTVDTALAEMAEMPVYAATVPPRADGVPVAFPPSVEATPAARHRACLLLKLVWRNVCGQVKGILFRETWKVGIVKSPSSDFADPDFLPSIHWLPNPGPHRFLADPFLTQVDDGFALMAEDFDFATNRGRIVQWRAGDASFSGVPMDAIAEDCHMSYPFLFQHKGETYCIPEAHEKGGVSAWRRDGSAWVDPREIFRAGSNPAPVDPTLIEHAGRWWLFCVDRHNGVNSRLLLYHADSPWGPWTAHARNPVKVDIRSSRPGGTPFVHRGELYRPAQDCSKHYGWRLMINRVTRLSPAEFAEETIRVFDSDRLGVDGIHTLSGSGSLSVVDGRVDRLSLRRIPRVLAHKWRHLAGSPAE